MNRRLAFLALIASFAATLQSAYPISRNEDIVRDLTTVFKPPSSFPPNNALRPYDLLSDGLDNGVRTIQPEGTGEGPNPETRLDRVPARAYPWIVAIAEGDRPAIEGYFCAGTLIAPNWVVTAAHCTYAWVRRWPIDAEVYVLTDTVKLAEPGPRYTVKRVIPHPQFDPRTLFNDIALLQIDTKGQRIGTPIQLEGPAPNAQVGEIAHILGWGVSNLNILERKKFEALQLLQAVVRGDTCFAAANYPRLKNSGVFCASSLIRYHDACYSFGGGPIVLRDPKGMRYLAGLVSWPARCPPQLDRLTAYLDVQFYVPWIKRTIQAYGGAGP